AAPISPAPPSAFPAASPRSTRTATGGAWREDALRGRRSLAALPRLPRGRLPRELQGEPDAGGADPQHDALEALPRGAARLPRGRLGPPRAHVQGRALRRVQGDPCGDARRPRSAAPLRPAPVRGAPDPGDRGRGPRGQRPPRPPRP